MTNITNEIKIESAVNVIPFEPKSKQITFIDSFKRFNEAAEILAEIVYWYRPSIKENKTTGIPEFEKRFKHDKYLQRSYYQLEENYNCSKKQAQDALKTLIRTGVVIQHLSDGIHGGNVMYLELVPDVLKKISTDVTEKKSHRNADSKNVPSNKNDITPLQKYDEVDTNLVLPNNENVTTYTDINIENKEENNTETTTIPEKADSKNVPTPVSDSHTVVCGNDRLFDITKELFTKYKKDYSIADPKEYKARVIPLPDKALNTLRRALELSPKDSPYVFYHRLSYIII